MNFNEKHFQGDCHSKKGFKILALTENISNVYNLNFGGKITGRGVPLPL